MAVGVECGEIGGAGGDDEEEDGKEEADGSHGKTETGWCGGGKQEIFPETLEFQ